MRVLFLFLDGVGLGASDPVTNPFARAPLTVLTGLLGGRRLVADDVPVEAARATVVPVDACLGVEGMPQSASGQATLLTGRNVPALTGGHYGPWPSPAIVEVLTNGNLFSAVRARGKSATFLNAYPPTYFAAMDSGRRMYSAVPRAALSAGLRLMDAGDLAAGRALAADFTGRGWHERLGLLNTPVLTPRAGGERMAALAAAHDFSFFEYWLSDYAGHGQDMAASLGLLEQFDEMLGGLLAGWDDEAGLILITSDHGNMEDLSTRGHTRNPVPALLVGAQEARRRAAASLRTLADVAPAILESLER